MPLGLRTRFSEVGHAEISFLTSFHHRMDDFLYKVGSCMTYAIMSQTCSLCLVAYKRTLYPHVMP